MHGLGRLFAAIREDEKVLGFPLRTDELSKDINAH